MYIYMNICVYGLETYSYGECIMDPTCNENKGYLMHNSNAFSILNCAFDSLFFCTQGGEHYFFKTKATNANMLVWKLLFLSFRPPQTMGNFLDISIARRKCPVRVQKVVFMVGTRRHYTVVPNVVFETLELYLLSVPSSTGGSWRPRETTGGHRGQLPCTDFGWFRKSTPINIYKYIYIYIYYKRI